MSLTDLSLCLISAAADYQNPKLRVFLSRPSFLNVFSYRPIDEISYKIPLLKLSGNSLEFLFFWRIRSGYSFTRWYYCLRQFTWRLHSIAGILARLVTAWFKQRDGKAGILWSKTLWAAVFAPLLHMRIAHIALSGEKSYFRRWEWAEHAQSMSYQAISLPPFPPSVIRHDKWCGQK
jgi:hypothetical protein